MAMPSVIIVGAGVAGVAAASHLLACGIRDLTILEAENRIGGRIFTTNLDKSVIELGAQWIHGEELNVVYGLGKPLGLIENSLNDFSKVTCVLSDGNFIDGKVSSLLYQVCQDILHEDTTQGFNSSVGEYISKRFKEKIITDIDEKITDSYLEWFHSFKNSIDGSDSWFEISSNNNDYVECNGNLLLRWKHGYKTILNLLMQKYSDDSSQELPVLNKTLLNKEVTNIIWKNVKPKVICRDGTSYSADHVIITVSLGVLKECVKTMFEPPLPRNKLRAIDGIEIGTVNKIFLKFPYKWWPDDCHGFSFLWKQQDKLNNCIIQDNFTWARDIFGFYTDDSGPTILLGWVVGPSARQMETFSDKEVEDACVIMLNKFLGRMYNIPQPVYTARSKWYSNPHFRGSYSYHSIRTENSNTTTEHLAEPLVVDNKPVVMFAGEATHNHYFSTVHGGLETGWREANRIISSYKPEDNCTEKNDQFCDVVIVGAGMAGLAAARTLLLSGIEKIVILEAQGQAGGRVHSVQLEEDIFIELGAQWIHGQGNDIYKLSHENGLLSEIVSNEGEGAYLQYDGSEISLSLVQEVNAVVGNILEECEQFCNSDSEPPRSVGDYMKERFTEYLDTCQDPPEVKQHKENLFDWHVRFQVIDNSCDKLETLSAKLWGCYQFSGGQDYINFKTGYRSLVDCLLEELPDYVLRLNAPVKQINWMKYNFHNDNGRESFSSVYCNKLCKTKTGTHEEFPAQVICDSGEKYNAKHVIVTSSLGYLKRNHCTLFRPLLPFHLQQVINNIGFDTINKIFLVYKNQWWTENDKGFQIIWSHKSISLLDEEESWMQDLSGFDVLQNMKGALLGWCGGKGAVMVEKIPEYKVGEHCTHLLCNITGNKSIPLPDIVVRSCWNSNQYVCGGYSHTTNLYEKSKFSTSTLASPVYTRTLNKTQHPVILLAGEAAHKEHFSTTHGAYESGESQAQFIVNYIKSNS